MKRRTWLATVAGLIASCGIAASSVSSGAQTEAQTSESLVVQQYHRADQRYLGREQHVLDGKALSANPQEHIEEYGIAPRASLVGPTTAERLLKGTVQTSPVVVDYDLTIPEFKRSSPGARAIWETRFRVDHSQKVNVLLGELYGLRVDRPEEYDTGAYSTKRTTARFTNSILYLEHHALGQMVTVVVSAKWTNYENLRSYLAGDISRVPNEREFFSSPEGVSWYEKVGPNPFVDETSNLRVWSARQVFPCKPGELSSRCLYKAHQPNFTHLGNQQAVLVGMSGMLQVNRPQAPASDFRYVDTFPVVNLGDGSGRVFRIGTYSPERTKHPDMYNPVNQLTMLLRAGGTPLNLADLKAYSFK